MASLSDILGGVGIAAQPLIQRREKEKDLLLQLVTQVPELANQPEIAQILRGSFMTPGLSSAFQSLEGIQDTRQEELLEQQRTASTDALLQQLQITDVEAGGTGAFQSVEEGMSTIGAGVQEKRARELEAAAKAETIRQAERDEDHARDLERDKLKRTGSSDTAKALNILSGVLNRGQDLDVDKPGAASFAAAEIDAIQARADAEKDKLFFLHELARVIDTEQIPGLSFFQGEPPSADEVEELLRDAEWVEDNQDKIDSASNFVAINGGSRDQILNTSTLADRAKAIDDDLAAQMNQKREERLVPERHVDPSHAALMEGGQAQIGESLGSDEALFPPGAAAAGAPPGQATVLFEASSPEIKAYIQSLPPTFLPTMQIIEAEYGHDVELTLFHMEKAKDRLIERYLESQMGTQ